jgi:hypothetical protein
MGKKEDKDLEIGVRKHGVAAEKEKFIRGLHIGSLKMPYSNKKKE